MRDSKRQAVLNMLEKARAHIDRLEEIAKLVHNQASSYYHLAQWLLEENETLGKEVEQLQVQLAGVGVAALGGTREWMRAKPYSYGWSPAYQDTLELRLKYDKVVEALRRIRKAPVATSELAHVAFIRAIAQRALAEIGRE